MSTLTTSGSSNSPVWPGACQNFGYNQQNNFQLGSLTAGAVNNQVTVHITAGTGYSTGTTYIQPNTITIQPNTTTFIPITIATGTGVSPYWPPPNPAPEIPIYIQPVPAQPEYSDPVLSEEVLEERDGFRLLKIKSHSGVITLKTMKEATAYDFMIFESEAELELWKEGKTYPSVFKKYHDHPIKWFQKEVEKKIGKFGRKLTLTESDPNDVAESPSAS